jgi:hypothetical protein
VTAGVQEGGDRVVQSYIHEHFDADVFLQLLLTCHLFLPSTW